MAERLSKNHLHPAIGLALSLLCGCTVKEPTPVYPNAGAVARAFIGGIAEAESARGAAVGALAGSVGGYRYVRVARAVLYRDDQDGGPFGVFSYLIAAQKDPNAPVGQRLRAATDAYGQEAPYCPANQADPSRFNLFVVPVTSARPLDADRALCKDQTAVATLLFVEYDTARASAMADRAGLDGQGPYLIASLKPLSTLSPEDRQNLLVWDVSAFEPRLVRLAVNEFIASANRPDDWDKISLRKWVLELRNMIATGSEGWGISREAAAAAIKGP